MSYRALAAAIRKGHTQIPEQKIWSCCALGAAYFATTGKRLSHIGRMIGDISASVGRECGWDPQICIKVSSMHETGMPRLQIADWLDSLEPRESDSDYTQRVLAEIISGVETSVGQELEPLSK